MLVPAIRRLKGLLYDPASSGPGTSKPACELLASQTANQQERKQ
jgi:hypothetical protein